MDYIEYFKDRHLLTSGRDNTKIAKNKTKTYILSLSPHTMNDKGENLCKFSTKECRSMCLYTSGRGRFSNVHSARQRRTNFFVNNKTHFLVKLNRELQAINGKGEKCLIRLNTISDVNWAAEFAIIGVDMNQYKNITFYDYTKDPFRIEGNLVDNQHFTFSFSGYNWKWCEKFLNEKRANVAIVFKNSVPLLYKGYKVINGTDDDERVVDEKGVIVGLKYKLPAGLPYSKNKFVIDE